MRNHAEQVAGVVYEPLDDLTAEVIQHELRGKNAQTDAALEALKPLRP
jgi:hypothetical protein